MTAPLPPDEVARLQALHDHAILNTEPEAAFDRITRLAARIFEAPIALVSFVDAEHQWFKSCYGLDACRTPRELSFCAHAILADEVMVVPDATLDARFIANTLVTGPPGICFYAGAPLLAPDGFKLGTLCVIDTKPRTLSDEQRDTLTDLAAMVVDEMQSCLNTAQLRAGIEESRRYQQALQEAEERAQLIVEIAHDAFVSMDAAGVITGWNGRAEALFGWPREEAMGRNLAETIIPPSFREAHWRGLEKFLETGQGPVLNQIFEINAVRRDGSEFPVELSISPLKWGGSYLFTAFVRDISERKRGQEALIQQTIAFQQQAELLDLAHDNIIVLDFDGVITFWNKGAERTYGWPSTEAIGQNFYHLLRSQLPQPLAEVKDALLRDGFWQGEAIYLRRDGTPITVATRWVLKRDEKGRATQILKISNDITERKVAEEALRRAYDELEMRVARRTDALAQANARLHESGARLQAILDNTTSVIYLKDSQGRYLLVNRRFEELFNLTREQIVGKSEHDIFPAEIADAFAANDQKVLEANGAIELEEQAPQADGLHTYISIKFPLRDAAGKAYGVCGISTDITERKRNEVALQAAKDEAERANRAKSELLSRTSHELRTPLNAILGFSQLLELDELSAEQSQFVAHIITAGRHQLELVDRVLDLARIESGRLEMAPQPMALGPILREALRQTQPLATERDVSLRLEESAGHHADSRVLADGPRLSQVLLNLLSNAVKYNRAGGSVALSCEKTGERLRIAVSDSGTGMTPDETARLFTLFDRLGAEEAGVTGTGIGLTLAKGLTEAMGGTLGAQSVPGEGSTFWVELPLTEDAATFAAENPPAPLGEAPPADDSPETHAVVLYIEDNLSNLNLVQHILRHRPEVKLLVAMQGGLGLELAGKHQPNLILLDLHLPDMQGDEVLRHLRSNPATQHIPVVMVSADASPPQIERLKNLGAIEYLTKPLDVKQFLQVLEDNLKTS